MCRAASSACFLASILVWKMPSLCKGITVIVSHCHRPQPNTHLHHRLVGLLHVTGLGKASDDHVVELGKLFAGKEDRGGGETESEVVGGRLAQLGLARDKVQEVVDQLKGDAQISAVLERGLLQVGAGARQIGHRLAGVRNQTGRLFERLLDVVRKAFLLVLLRAHLHELAQHEVDDGLAGIRQQNWTLEGGGGW